MLFPIILLCAVLQCKAEPSYDVYIEDAELFYVNTDICDPEECSITVKEGDDGNKIDLKLRTVVELPNNTLVQFSIYGYSMGDYKLSMGISVERVFCELFDDPVFLLKILSEIGIETCPLPPETYILEDYYPDMENMPAVFPPNKYKVIIKFLSAEGADLLIIYVYINVM